LVLHNEVVNFWTHFIPLLVWLVWLLYLAFSWEDFFQPFHYPMLCFWAGACSYALFSSTAHLFSCKSFMVRTVCFILDYLGIALYALGGGISALFYMNPTVSPFFSYKVQILCIEVGLAVMATLVGGLTRFFWRDYRFFIRAGMYFPLYICCVTPYLYRVTVCWLRGTDCVPQTTFWQLLAMFLTGVLVFFFVTKIPERYMPGKFDYLFQSHQLFHVSAACSTSVQMYFIPMEIRLRRSALSTVEDATPSWDTTFLPFMLAEVAGLLVVGVLGYLTWKGTLTAKKKTN
jgi:adiponectin receptor